MLKPMIDMAKTAEEMEKDSSPILAGGQEKYPYGLRIYLSHDEIEKLGVDVSDWEVGATFHLFALAKVTSISQNETENGTNCHVSLQITHLSGESEDAENREMDKESEEPNLKKYGYLRYNS
jgi:hypothetical protein